MSGEPYTPGEAWRSGRTWRGISLACFFAAVVLSVLDLHGFVVAALIGWGLSLQESSRQFGWRDGYRDRARMFRERAAGGPGDRRG